VAKRETKQAEIRQLLKRRGALAAPEIAKVLNLTQPSFSRLVSTMPDLLILGAAQNRLYALSRTSEKYPIVKVGENAEVYALGELCLLEPKGAAFIPSKQTNLRLKVFEDVPYFVWDLRPQGYLGKIFVSQHPELKLPERWEDWREEDLFKTLNLRGDDLVGNLLIGRVSFERFQIKEPEIVLHAQRKKKYPVYADRTLRGAFVGSSAGGEQPKFTLPIQNEKNIQHVIVKFSPPNKTAAGLRWADLLYAEELALNILREGGYSAAKAEAFEAAGRVFLEGVRCDRVGLKGRQGVLTLGAIDDEFIGSRESWTKTALRLREQKRINKQDASTMIFLDCFGSLIANSDRHFGNLSLYWELDAKNFSLAPVYDMLPMAYAPAQGNVVKRDFKKPVSQFEQIEVWESARVLAIEFWRRLSLDDRVSSNFRAIAKANQKIIEGRVN